MFIQSCVTFWLMVHTFFVYADNLPTTNWIIFTNPPAYNGSARLNFKAGSSVNISWAPGGSGPEGLISIRLLGGESNVTIAPDIAKGIHRNVGNFNWTIPSALPVYPFYDLEIVLTSNASVFSQADSFFTIDLTVQSTSTTSSSTSTTEPSSQSSSTLSFPTTITTTSSSIPSITQPPAASNGLSTGAKAGIGVSSAVAGIAVLLLLGIFIYRRGKKATTRHEMPAETGDKPLTATEWAELEDMRRAVELGSYPALVLHEMSGGDREELEARRRHANLQEMQ